MSSKYDEIGENSYFQRSQQILNDLQRQHQHQPMFHFNYGEPHLSMKKHRQATPQEPPTNYSEMLWLHQFASNKLEAGESSPPVLSSSSTRNSAFHIFTSFTNFTSSVHWQLIAIYYK